jgi:hypothetical protein
METSQPVSPCLITKSLYLKFKAGAECESLRKILRSAVSWQQLCAEQFVSIVTSLFRKGHCIEQSLQAGISLKISIPLELIGLLVHNINIPFYVKKGLTVNICLFRYAVSGYHRNEVSSAYVKPVTGHEGESNFSLFYYIESIL